MYSGTMNGDGASAKPMTNGHIDNAELLEHLVNNTERMTRLMSQMYGDRRRNIESECGYVSTGSISAWDYQKLWDRDPVAGRVVNVFPMESWQQPPQLIEDEDVDNITEFEAAWTEVGKNITTEGLDGWYRDDQVNSLWSYLERADIYSGIGSYGAMLLGVDDNKDMREPANLNKKAGTKLNFIRVLSECEARISRFNTEEDSVRYGKPEMYSVLTGLPTLGTNGEYVGATTGVTQTQTKEVHWSRIVHVVDNPYGSEVGGIPRMQQPFNRLYDLHKMYGGSTEMYWQGAFPGISFETHPQLGGDVNLTPETQTAMRAQLVNYTQGLQRYLTMAGMTAKTLSPTVVDPSANIDKLIEAICILTGIPKRIFMGSERGELASTTDLKSWYGRCRHRQTSYITPFLIARFIDRLILLGVLPIPSKGYGISWPDLAAASDLEKAQIAVQRTTAMSSYVMGGLVQLIAPKDFMTRVIGYDETEANQILEDTQDNMDQIQEADLKQQTAPPEPNDNGSPVGNEAEDYYYYEDSTDKDYELFYKDLENLGAIYDEVQNGGPGSGPHKGLHNLLTKHGYNHQYTEFAQGSNSKQVGSQKQPDIGHYQHPNGNTATANTYGQWRIKVNSNPPKFIRGENVKELKEHFRVDNTWSDESRKAALEARKAKSKYLSEAANEAGATANKVDTHKAHTEASHWYALATEAVKDNDSFDPKARELFNKHLYHKDQADKIKSGYGSNKERQATANRKAKAATEEAMQAKNPLKAAKLHTIAVKANQEAGNLEHVKIHSDAARKLSEKVIKADSTNQRQAKLDTAASKATKLADKATKDVKAGVGVSSGPTRTGGKAFGKLATTQQGTINGHKTAAKLHTKAAEANEAAGNTELAIYHNEKAKHHKEQSRVDNSNPGHKGRPGKRGGSLPKESSGIEELQIHPEYYGQNTTLTVLRNPTKQQMLAWINKPKQDDDDDMSLRMIAPKGVNGNHYAWYAKDAVHDQVLAATNTQNLWKNDKYFNWQAADEKSVKLFLETMKHHQVNNTLVENAKFSSTQLTVTQPEVLVEVKLLQDMISPSDVVELETEPHITVRYGLHTQDASDVAGWVDDAGPILIKIGRLSVFTTNPEFDVLKFEIESNPLHNLNDTLGLLDNSNDYPVYNPHMTIAYLRKGTGLTYAANLPNKLFGTRLLFHTLTFSNVDKQQTELPLSIN